MRKFLSLLSAVCLVSTGSASVVSCNSHNMIFANNYKISYVHDAKVYQQLNLNFKSKLELTDFINGSPFYNERVFDSQHNIIVVPGFLADSMEVGFMNSNPKSEYAIDTMFSDKNIDTVIQYTYSSLTALELGLKSNGGDNQLFAHCVIKPGSLEHHVMKRLFIREAPDKYTFFSILQRYGWNQISKGNISLPIWFQSAIVEYDTQQVTCNGQETSLLLPVLNSFKFTINQQLAKGIVQF